METFKIDSVNLCFKPYNSLGNKFLYQWLLLAGNVNNLILTQQLKVAEWAGEISRGKVSLPM